MIAAPSPHARRALALAAIVGMAVPFLLSAQRVQVAVDGDVQSFSTYRDTVDEVLAEAGVEVGAHDLVLPSPYAAVTQGTAIEVRRATAVRLATDERIQTVRTTARTVAGVLTAAGLAETGVAVDPPPSTPIERAGTIVVQQPSWVHVTADGRATAIRVVGGTVGDALALAGIEVGPEDTVTPPAETPVSSDLDVRVARHDVETIVEEVPLHFHEQVVPSDDLFTDQQEVTREGSEGLRHDTYRVRYLDGEVVERELVSEEVVVEPIDRIVTVGTRERPAPPPAPEPAPPPAGANDPAGEAVWDRLARCESGGRWDYRGTYHGGLQFHPDTWDRWKPSGFPDHAYQATRLQQIEVGRRLQAARGWNPWPSCARKLGLM